MWQYFFFVPLDRIFRLPGAEHPYRLCEDMVLECISNGRLFQARVSAAIASSTVNAQRGHPWIEARAVLKKAGLCCLFSKLCVFVLGFLNMYWLLIEVFGILRLFVFYVDSDSGLRIVIFIQKFSFSLKSPLFCPKNIFSLKHFLIETLPP